jgi:choline dehydrogenase
MKDSERVFVERVRANQQKLSSQLGTRFDYIVCGAGTSGSVVAGRLAADLRKRVLVLEVVQTANIWVRDGEYLKG